MRRWMLAMREPWVHALARRKRRTARGHEKGQALIEWLIVSMLATLAAVWAAGEFARQAQDAAAQAHAQWLLTVGDAVKRVLAAEQANVGVSQPNQALVLQALPSGTVTPIAPWLARLQAAGWLPPTLAKVQALPYEVSLLKLPSRGTCVKAPCAHVVLLLAAVRPGQRVPDVASVLMALKGQGLAVTDLAPERLRGPTFDLPNPPVGQQRLQVGSLALLAWRDDHEPPYVRVTESRQVRLSGGVVLGKHQGGDSACSPAGLVLLNASGHLQVCRNGRWGSVVKDHEHFRACHANKRQETFQSAWFQHTRFWELLNASVGARVACECDPGFARVKMIGNDGRVGSVTLRDGYLCQRL